MWPRELQRCALGLQAGRPDLSHPKAASCSMPGPQGLWGDGAHELGQGLGGGVRWGEGGPLPAGRSFEEEGWCRVSSEGPALPSSAPGTEGPGVHQGPHGPCPTWGETDLCCDWGP